jgi:hypothetical protein
VDWASEAVEARAVAARTAAPRIRRLRFMRRLLDCFKEN